MRTVTAGLASFALLFPVSANADPVHEALDAYALYQSDVSTLLDVDVTNGATVDAALARISRHNSDDVARGWIAYSALTAAQSPQFAAGVSRQISDNGRAAVLDQLRNDPGYARRQDGSAQAIHLIFDAASADGARANQIGDRYDAYARNAPQVQMVASVFRVDLPGGRLTAPMLERLHIGPRAAQPANDASDFGGRNFWNSLAGRDGSPGPRGGHERAPYTPVTDHILTLAAFVVAGANNDSRVDTLLNDTITKQCMQMQRLELRQCLSVSHDPTERAYCLGHHGLSGPGDCFSAMQR